MRLRSIVVTAGFLLASDLAETAEIQLLASGAVKEAYLELLPNFEKASGHTVKAAWSNTTDIGKRVAGGEVTDLVILGNNGTEALIQDGKLVASTRTAFAKSGIYVAVRTGAPAPDIGSADALKRSVLAAKSVAYSGGASGTYIVTMFQKLGIYDEVRAKASVTKPNEPVGGKVVRGDAEIGFHQLSELIPVKGIDIVGPLPAELQEVTVFSGALHSAAKEPDAAGVLIKFLIAPAAADTLKKHGLEPAVRN
ncbi:MAG: ABC transporter substrate-binding protein [Alphaproteobacteria bacterium]|nr:MAG: ABC transporter substrate-binding protein [Alphaproteobacteria bacterium]